MAIVGTGQPILHLHSLLVLPMLKVLSVETPRLDLPEKWIHSVIETFNYVEVDYAYGSAYVIEIINLC